jgi:hypothetical protein
MTGSELLLTMMAAAVTFAGFTGIVALIDRRAAHVSQVVVAWRVRNLNVAVLLVMVLCAMPFVLSGYGFATDNVWRTSCGAAGAIGAAYIVYLFVGRARLLRHPIEGFSHSQFNLLIGVGILLDASLFAGMSGYIRPEGTFLLGVFYFLAAVASFFIRLVLMLADSIRNAD